MPTAEHLHENFRTIEELIGIELLEQARGLCLTSIQESGENAQLLNYLGVIEHKSGNLPEALKNFEKALTYTPDNPQLEKNIEITKGMIECNSPENMSAGAMEFTGERFVPELSGQIAYEHYHRYAFAREYAKGKAVLDIASGEGYGTALLAGTAGSVLGVDISPEAVQHARARYSSFGNLDFKEGRCEDVPAADDSFDMVVSFETIEHIEDQHAFLSEVVRVLKKGGVFIVSSPNKRIYSDEKNYNNPYHLKELYKDELESLLRQYFKNVHLFGQRLTFSSHIWPLGDGTSPTFVHYSKPNAELRTSIDPPFEDEYTLAVCSDGRLSMQSGASLFTSEQDELYREFTGRGATTDRSRNDPPREKASSSVNVAQMQSNSKPPALKPEIHAIHSIQDYEKYLSENSKVLQEREGYETALIPNQDSFFINGYCWICGKPSQFLVDYQHAEISISQAKSGQSRKPLWRERTACVQCGYNNRMRAFVHFVDTVLRPGKDSALYMTEQVTPLYGYFLRNYSRTVGSEYLGKAVELGTKDSRGIRNEDLTRLTFSDRQFDFVFSLEVLEHVPDYQKALREAYRVLAPGGKLVFSAPFLMDSEKNIIRCKVENGELRHLLPPEYHGDPLNPGGCLCYQYFGWELADELKSAGFSNLTAYSVYSREYAYLGRDVVFLIAEKGEQENPQRFGDNDERRGDPTSIRSRERGASINSESEREKILEAEALIGESKLEDAESILQDCIRMDPSNLDALNDLAVTEILLGKNEEAIVHLREVISVDPENSTAKENIRLILQKMSRVLEGVRSGKPSVPADASKKTITQAEELMLANRYDEAEELLAGVLAGSPSNPAALNDLAVLRSQRGDLEASIALLGKVAQIDPANTVARKNLGRLFLQTGRVEDALKSYAAVLKQAPRDIETISTVAEICRQNGRDSDAMFFYRRLLELDPNNERAIAQVRGAKENKSFSITSSAEDFKRLDTNGVLCLNPFYFFEVDITGEVVVCCTAWLKRRLGNIKNQTIAEIWNGEPIKDLRRRMYRGEWEDWCSADCPRIVEYRLSKKLIPFDGLETNAMLTPRLVGEIKSRKDSLESTPTLFKLSDSKTCNISCIMCSVKQDVRLKDDPAMLEKRSRDMYQYLDSAKTVLMSGNGDPLARADTRSLLMNYDGHNPELKFSLVTNALLLPRYWDSIKHQRYDFIDISVDASTKETYEKIRAGGKWEELLRGLSLVKANQDKFESVILSMVVMRSNYREIPSFIDFAESYGFYAMFSRIHGMFGDENIFELNDSAALDELRQIVSDEDSKQRSIQVLWQDLMEFSNQTVAV